MGFFSRKKEQQPTNNDYAEALAKLTAIADEAEKDPIARELHEETPVDGRLYKDENKQALFERLKTGMTRTRENFSAGLSAIFTASEIDDDFYDELEEFLIGADVGAVITEEILDELRDKVKEQHLKSRADCRNLLIDSIRSRMETGENEYKFEDMTSVVFVIGVNGVGKTTTIGKLSSKLSLMGKKVLVAGADTFRAAAEDQLKVWAERSGVQIVTGKDGQDPASVVYDACNAARARGTDVLIIDTAGRLHNKKNLMDELAKMNRVIDKEFEAAHRENLLVLDATTGQNALNQAREFNEAAPLSGIILTKMDGTAKGGIAIAIQAQMGIPVKYIGVGEKIEDLQKFNASDFVNAIFDVETADDVT